MAIIAKVQRQAGCAGPMMQAHVPLRRARAGLKKGMSPGGGSFD